MSGPLLAVSHRLKKTTAGIPPVKNTTLQEQPIISSSISKRFTYALIGVVTLLLIGFATVVIFINVRRVDADLKNRLDNAVKLAQVSLASTALESG